jgi:uncharacterized protein (TIGR02996 family)
VVTTGSVVSDLPVHPGEPRDAELEAAVLADPQDRLAWRVYADWLMDQGSLRGELVASMAGFTRGERTDELMRAHPERFLGPLVEPELSRWAWCDWLPGFWRTLTLAPPPMARVELQAALQRLLGHPSAALLQGLHVEMTRRQSAWQEVLKVLLGRPQGETLRDLVFRGPGEPGDSPTLDVSELAPLLEGRLPRLESLTLAGTLSTDSLPELLARSRLLPGLRRLDLTGGTLTDVGGQELLSRAEHFRHLERLDLDGNRVGRLGSALERALPEVRLGRQRR